MNKIEKIQDLLENLDFYEKLTEEMDKEISKARNKEGTRKDKKD